MNKIDYLLHDVCDILEDTGDYLKREPKNRVALRLMHHQLQERTKESRNPNVLFLNFFMTAYIRELFMNLLTDFPYKKEEFGQLRTDLLNDLTNEMGDLFQELSNSLIEEDDTEAYKIYSKLVGSYYCILSKLEERYWEVE